MVNRYAAPEIRDRYLPRMTAETREEMWTGTQFMTEQIGGSDVRNLKWKRVSRTVNGVFAATSGSALIRTAALF